MDDNKGESNALMIDTTTTTEDTTSATNVNVDSGSTSVDTSSTLNNGSVVVDSPTITTTSNNNNNSAMIAVKSPSSEQVQQQSSSPPSNLIPSLPISGMRIASPSSAPSSSSSSFTTTSARVPNSYDLFNPSSQLSNNTTTSTTTSNNNNNSTNSNSDLAISFFIPSSPLQQSLDSTRDSFSFSPQLIGSSSGIGNTTSNRRQKQQQQQPLHSCNEQCNHQQQESRKTKGTQLLGNNMWRRLQRGIRSFKRIFCASSSNSTTTQEEEGDMPILVIAQDMSIRIHLFSTMFLNWFKTLIVFMIGFILNLKHLISTGGYKQLLTKKNISDNLTITLSNWIQSLQNTNPEAYWLLGNVQQFISFFIYPLSLTLSRNYSLSFQQHQQLKTHFLFCVIILTFSLMEILIGMIQYGGTHNHESSSILLQGMGGGIGGSVGSGGNSVDMKELENIVQSYRNHGFMVSLLILFSGFYLLHRGFMFLIDLIVIYIKTTQVEQDSASQIQGSSSSVITKSSLMHHQQQITNKIHGSSSTTTTTDNRVNDSPLGNVNDDDSGGSSSSRLAEEGAIRRLLFQPYTFSLWKRLRVLLRFSNAVFSSFLSLSIFSEMIQYLLATKFSSPSHHDNDSSTTSTASTITGSSVDSVDILNQYSVSIFTYLLVIFGLFINGLSIYLFGNYSGTSSGYQTKKNEEDFLLLSSVEQKRKNASSNGSSGGNNHRGSVHNNRMNTSSPMWFQQFSSFNSVFNTSQTSTIGRYYNMIHNYTREKIPAAKFWIYIIMREAHIHVALFIYLKTVYYSNAGIGFDFILCCMSTMTCVFFSLPVLKTNGKILLQTTPENLSNHLNSCVKEVSSMVEGVLECHSEHFWALNCSSLDEADEDVDIDVDKRKQELIATIKVRVANNVQVDHQRVLQSVRRIFCSNGLLKEHNLTVQVEKNTILGLEKIYQDE